jgi:hypothetical protein
MFIFESKSSMIMKFLLLLLLPIFLNAQDSIQSQNISVISAEKLNIVYRGVPNPIKIAVPGAKSFVATAPGLVKMDSMGNYRLSAGSGNTVTVGIDAIMHDNTTKHEEKIFRIKPFPALTAVLNNNTEFRGNYYLTKEELIKSQVNGVLVNMLMFESNIDFGISQFEIIIPSNKKRKTFIVTGNTMSKEVITELEKVRAGSLIIIYGIKTWQKIFDGYFDKVSSIVVEIRED